MAELPSEFGLNSHKDEKTGKTIITGENDRGESYEVRSVDAITPSVIDDIAASDRTRTDAYAYVENLLHDQKEREKEFDRQMTDEFFEATEHVMRGAWHGTSTEGWTPKYGANYDRVFGGKNDSQA